jgi:hypothetical protein
MHLHISGMQVLINGIGAVIFIGTINLLSQHFKANPPKSPAVATFFASWDALMNNH